MRAIRQLTTLRPARHALVLGIALVAAMGCAERAPEQGAKPAAPSQAANAAAPSQAQTRLDARTLGWTLGKAYPYRVKLTTKIAFDGGPNNFDFDLEGEALVVPVKVTPDEATLYLSVADARIVSRVPGSQSELDKAAADIRAAGIFFTLSGGRTTEFRLPKAQSQLAGNSYRAIASALQFARADGPTKQYSAEEYDTTGRALTEYQATADPTVWHKQKTRYVRVLGTAEAFEGRQIPLVPEITSQGEIRLTPSGRPDKVDLAEQISVRGAQVPIRSDVTLTLAGAPEQAVATQAADWDAKLAASTRVAAEQPIGAAAPAADLDTARIGGLDFEHVLARLEQIAKEKLAANAKKANEPSASDASSDDAEQAKRENQVQEDSKLFFALSALFRKEPATVGRALAAIRANSPASSVLMDALSSAGSAEGQRALVTLMDDKRVDPEIRNRAINSLARTPTPTDGSIRALKALLREDPFDMRALYGLGTYARKLRDDGKSEQARALGELLVAELKLAQHPTDRQTVLRAIANSGYAGALSGVEPYLADRDESVRSAAVRALQSMHDPRVDGLLASRLTRDASSDVRLSAMASMQVRQPNQTLADALASAGTVAADARVRFGAVELMIRWLPEQPALRTTLEKVATSDTEPRVRDRAKAAL
jgi:hypothetical protein